MTEPQSVQGVERRHLVVRCGGVRCALPARSVRRVVRGLVLTRVPGADRRLLGLAHYGGEPLVVLDLLTLVARGEEEHGGAAEVVVVAAAGPPGARELIGLGVDEALEVASIDPAGVAPTGAGLVRGEALIGDLPVRVLDLETLGGEG